MALTMETFILKGDHPKEAILIETKSEIAALKEKYGRVPGISFIGFKGVPLAKYSIPLHVNLAEALGFKVSLTMKEENVTEEDLFRLIDSLNSDNEIHAICILQPIPPHLNAMRIVNRVDVIKEVEGFHPQNLLSTMLPEVLPGRYPMCLPTALEMIFADAGITTHNDQEWVFLLDDEFLHNDLTNMIVRTAAMTVIPKDCPVTFVNKNSRNIVEHCKRADILIIVTKFAEYVQPEWLKPGVCIIDIYSNLVKEVPSKNDPAMIVPIIRGGIHIDKAQGIAGAILPIPGGLMTVVLALLMRNSVMAFRNHLNSSS